jgi:hypothetical protein
VITAARESTLSLTSGEKTIHQLFHNHDTRDKHVFGVYYVIYWMLTVVTYGVKVPSGLFVGRTSLTVRLLDDSLV